MHIHIHIYRARESDMLPAHPLHANRRMPPSVYICPSTIHILF